MRRIPSKSEFRIPTSSCRVMMPRASAFGLLKAAPQDQHHNEMPLPEKPVLPYVRELRMPTLILIGSGDIADNQAVAGALVMAIPGASRVVVPDTGHLMYLEKPEVFSSLVGGFLNSHAF
jgi:3-oxoadipate enol-lactonase